MDDETRNPTVLCPLMTRVTAVYLVDDHDIERWPVVALALYENPDGTTANEIQFVHASRSGIIENPMDDANLLGYEFDNLQQNWDKKIAELKQRVKETTDISEPTRSDSFLDRFSRKRAPEKKDRYQR